MDKLRPDSFFICIFRHLIFTAALSSVNSINATYILELNKSIDLGEKVLKYSFHQSHHEDWEIHFLLSPVNVEAFVEILVQNFAFNDSLPSLQVWQRSETSGSIQRYSLAEQKSRMIVRPKDFMITFCSDSVLRNGLLSVTFFSTSCSKQILDMNQGTIKVSLSENRPRRCAWIVQVDSDEQIEMNVSTLIRFATLGPILSNPLNSDQLIMMRNSGENISSLEVPLNFNTSIHSHSNLIIFEYISGRVNALQNFFLQFRAVTDDSILSNSHLERPIKLDYNCVCGRENIEERIIGGQEVRPEHRFPWIVGLMKPNGEFFCAGSIINREFILTAAHCFEAYINGSLSLAAVKISIGVHSLNETGEDNRVESVSIHEGYRRTGQALVNDIALIRVAKKLTFNAYIRPICLPSTSMTDFENLTVAGWGYTSEDGPTSEVLRQVTLPYVSNHICRESHGEVITENMMCAGGIKNQDSCQGDSGAPMMYWKYGHVFVVGLVSFGLGCGRPTYYGVYTRVTQYLSWIYEKTWEYLYCARPPRIVTTKPPISPASATPQASVDTFPVAITELPTPAYTIRSTYSTLFQPLPPSTEASRPIFPNLENCGIPNLKSTILRIFGGQETSPQEFPWMVALAYKGAYMEGGVLISPYYVLSSARRLKIISSYWDFSLDDLRVILGAHDLTIQESSKRLYKVESLIFHPSFGRWGEYDSDFALIKLLIVNPNQEQEMKNFRPICLPKSLYQVIDGASGMGLGWGSVSQEGKTPNPRLKKARLDMISAESCRNFYGRLITMNMLCAGKPGSDMCMGDGGGPLMFPYRQRWYLIGIFSWSPPGVCAIPNKPSVFADVRTALPWISYITGLQTL